MATDQSIGLMDGAYFVGRKEVLDWINSTLCLNLDKIEKTASGAVACQLLDSMYPGTVAMHKVNWEARADYEYVQNYKVLQSGFNKHKITRHIEVDKLVRAKYQDNLEFMQWFKRFYELNSTFDNDYDTQAVRAKGKGGKKLNSEAPRKKVGAKTSDTKTRPTARTTARSTAASTTRSTATSRTGTTSQKENVRADKANAEENTVLLGKIDELEKNKEELESGSNQLKMTLEGLEKERDFYFGKLRDIEILCQDQPEENPFVQSIFKILYATEEDFVAVDDADDQPEGQDTDHGAEIPPGDNNVVLQPEDEGVDSTAIEDEGVDSTAVEGEGVDSTAVEVEVDPM